MGGREKWEGREGERERERERGSLHLSLAPLPVPLIVRQRCEVFLFWYCRSSTGAGLFVRGPGFAFRRGKKKAGGTLVERRDGRREAAGVMQAGLGRAEHVYLCSGLVWRWPECRDSQQMENSAARSSVARRTVGSRAGRAVWRQRGSGADSGALLVQLHGLLEREEDAEAPVC